jgi:hypothetical protein
VPRPLPDRAELGRRAVLGAGAAVAAGLALAACTGPSGPTTPTGAGRDPDAAARLRAAGTEQRLVASATAVGVHSRGAVGARARAAAAAHRAHVVALLGGLATPSPSPTATATGPTGAHELAAAQARAAASYQAMLAGLGSRTAELLASVAGSDLAHAAAMRAALR